LCEWYRLKSAPKTSKPTDRSRNSVGSEFQTIGPATEKLNGHTKSYGTAGITKGLSPEFFRAQSYVFFVPIHSPDGDNTRNKNNTTTARQRGAMSDQTETTITLRWAM